MITFSGLMRPGAQQTVSPQPFLPVREPTRLHFGRIFPGNDALTSTSISRIANDTMYCRFDDTIESSCMDLWAGTPTPWTRQTHRTNSLNSRSVIALQIPQANPFEAIV